VNPTVTRNIEDLLRDAAPAVPYNEEHRRQLLLALRADALCHRRERRRLRGYLVMAGLLLFLLLLGCPSGRSGGDAFEMRQLTSVSPEISASPAFFSPHLRYGSYLEGRSGMSGVECAEAWVQHWRAGDYQLEAIAGWETESGTWWLIGYTHDISGSQETVWQMPFFPPGSVPPPRQQAEYDRIEKAEAQVRDGLAVYLGASDCFVDGYPVRCERWLTHPEQGDIVFLQGRPLLR
jgi:hypothetical protein